MKLKTVFMALEKFCTRKYLDFPDGGYTVNGETFTYEDLRYELRKLKEWIYPEKTDNVVLCTFCRECRHYKKFRYSTEGRRGDRFIMLCEIDKRQKPKNHYCGYGVQRESENISQKP